MFKSSSVFSSLSRLWRPPSSTLFPYTTLFRSGRHSCAGGRRQIGPAQHYFCRRPLGRVLRTSQRHRAREVVDRSKDRKSTRLNSSHLGISYAVFCLKKKKNAD